MTTDLGDFVPKRILVTGAAGFIASNLVLYLLEKYVDIKVVVVDVLSYNSNLRNLESVQEDPRFTFVQEDICNYESMVKIFKTHEIDCVFHLAAETHVDRSFLFSFKFTQSNFVGTHVLLEATRSLHPQVKRFIHISTDEVYGTSEEGQPAKSEEAAILLPTNPYAATKAGAEMMVMSYNISYQLPTIITRGSNVFGPRQFPDKMVPKFISILNNCPNKKLPIHGNGEVLRSFIYVEDVASALDCVMKKGKIGQTYNISDGTEFSVLHVAKELCKIMGVDPDKKLEHVRDRNFNDKRYFISHEKLLSLGWKPSFDFEDSLKKTVDWYLEHANYWDRDLLLKSLEAHPRFVSDEPCVASKLLKKTSFATDSSGKRKREDTNEESNKKTKLEAVQKVG